MLGLFCKHDRHQSSLFPSAGRSCRLLFFFLYSFLPPLRSFLLLARHTPAAPFRDRYPCASVAKHPSRGKRRGKCRRGRALWADERVNRARISPGLAHTGVGGKESRGGARGERFAGCSAGGSTAAEQKEE